MGNGQAEMQSFSGARGVWTPILASSPAYLVTLNNHSDSTGQFLHLLHSTGGAGMRMLAVHLRLTPWTPVPA